MTLTAVNKGTREWDPKAPGLLIHYTGTDPAAGVEISETVPTGKAWKLLSFKSSITTDGTAVNRVMRIIFDNGATDYFLVAYTSPAQATNTYEIAASVGGPYYTHIASGGQHTGLPDIVISAGHRIKTSTINMVAGDNWAAPQFYVLEYSV